MTKYGFGNNSLKIKSPVFLLKSMAKTMQWRSAWSDWQNVTKQSSLYQKAIHPASSLNSLKTNHFYKDSIPFPTLAHLSSIKRIIREYNYKAKSLKSIYHQFANR